jgi:signal transduction histidine kinase
VTLTSLGVVAVVVPNLALNGLEAMRDTKGRDPALMIRTGRADAASVTVRVEDAGTGIDTQDVERLFQPLYTTKTEGLGMGLAIARTIVDAHGGRLWASNKTSGGATSAFTLPVERERPS